MEFTVLFFARSREVAGVPSIDVTLPEGSTTTELLKLLVERYPGMESVLQSCVLAVNQEYVSKDEATALQGGDEIAIIPPLSGG